MDEEECLTEYEIRQKIDIYKLSDAPIEVKENAIRELEKKLYPQDSEAKQAYVEGLSDVSDMGSSY